MARQAELDQSQSESVQEETAAIDDKVYQAIAPREEGIERNELAELMKQKKLSSKKLAESLKRLIKNGCLACTFQ